MSTAVMTATGYFVSLYHQRVLELSPLQTGLTLVPMSIVLTVGALASKTLLPKYGAPAPIITGSFTMAVGLAWLAAVPTHNAYLTHSRFHAHLGHGSEHRRDVCFGDRLCS
ncbi:hypothetical protein [Nocardia sp. NPDC004711]